MLHRNAFNIADWKLLEKGGTLVLRPRVKHAFFRFLFGTGFFALLTFGILGIDAELKNMRHGRRFTEEDIASMRSGPAEQAARLIAAGNEEEARAVQQSAETFINNYARKRQTEMAALEAAHRPWQLLLAGLAGVCVFFGMYLPLSPLWQRVRIACEGGDLIIRKNLFPRTRRVPIAAVRHAQVRAVAENVMHVGQWMTVGYYWILELPDDSEPVLLYIATTSRNITTMPPGAAQFLSALQHIAG
jgi:hypothetical protein